MPEMLIVFPLVVVLIMCIVQLGLLYRAKATLNNATFLAARSGSLHNGFTTTMTKVFLGRMAALGKIEGSRKSDLNTAGFFNNPNDLRLASVRAETVLHHTYPTIEIMFPTQAVFNHFAVQVQELEACSGSACPGGGSFRMGSNRKYEIPNNNMDARDSSLQSIDGRQVTLQDANLLSIRSRFCYEMEVPVANFIISRMINKLGSADADLQICRQLRNATNVIPLTGHSIVRMQSPFRCQGDEENGSDCTNI
jgi:hypothetical protein